MTRGTVAVLGAGLMGHGIVALFSANGYLVRVYDPSPHAKETLRRRLDEAHRVMGVADPAPVETVEQVREAVQGAQWIIEAAPEDVKVKQSLVMEVVQYCTPDAIIASTTSAIPAGLISEPLRDADASRVLVSHFWNPPHLVPLVEVVGSSRTSEDVVERTVALLESLGKKVVRLRRDIPGFIGNRLQHALKREAIWLVGEGVCDPEAVDTVVKYGFGSRLAVLGPLEQSDLVGLDLTLAIHDFLLQHLDRSTRPHPLLKQKVAAGELGVKTGRGFYHWTPDAVEALRRRLADHILGLYRQGPRQQAGAGA